MVLIGLKNINTNIFLAPLAGCADLSFRLIAREHGAQFCFYEMFDSNSLVWASRRKINDMVQTHPKDLPIAAQLLGSDPDIMLKAAKKLLELSENISFLDINAACPMRKIIKKKAGAYLLKEPEVLYKIISKLSSSLHLPITVKIRTGYAVKDIENIILIAKKCEQSGAQALFVHGRTKDQEYSGEVDYESIKAIKDNVAVPVMASGDIFSPQKAKQMLDTTGCDGLIVARGAFGNPWLFKQIESFLNKGIRLLEPTLNEKLLVSIRHIQYVEKYKILPVKSKLGFARKVALWYLKGFKQASFLRKDIARVQSFEELYKFIETLINSLQS